MQRTLVPIRPLYDDEMSPFSLGRNLSKQQLHLQPSVTSPFPLLPHVLGLALLFQPRLHLVPMLAILQMNLKVLHAFTWTRRIQLARTVETLDARQILVREVLVGLACGDWLATCWVNGAVFHDGLEPVVRIGAVELGEGLS